MEDPKILVIQTAFPGDAILTLPMIQELKKIFPSSKIDVIGIPGTYEIFKYSPHINEVIILDKRGSQRSLFQLFKFISLIKKKKYHRIYSPHRSLRTSLIVWFSKVKKTFGFDTASFSFVYEYKIKYKSDIHEVARNLNLVGLPIEKDNWKIFPEIIIPEEVNSKIEMLLNLESNKKYVALAPGSVWATKRYPKEYYKKIIEYLLNKDYSVVLIGGNDDQILCEDLEKGLRNNIKSFAGNLKIIESIALIKHCELLICNDSAPTHMGMAAGIPVLTIYCSTLPDFGFYPYSSKSCYLSFDDLKCKPCGIHGHNKCPIKTFECGYKLLPEEVIKSIDLLID